MSRTCRNCDNRHSGLSHTWVGDRRVLVTTALCWAYNDRVLRPPYRDVGCPNHTPRAEKRAVKGGKA